MNLDELDLRDKLLLQELRGISHALARLEAYLREPRDIMGQGRDVVVICSNDEREAESMAKLVLFDASEEVPQ